MRDTYSSRYAPPTSPRQPLELNHEALLAADQPVLMLNLLRYRTQADYGPHATQAPRSGRAAYHAYRG